MVIFEVRRKPRNIEPEAALAFAGRIEDTGSEKGYFVTPLGRKLSKGARKIADCNEIGHIQLSVDSSPENYVMKYLNDFFVGLTSTMATLKGELSYELRDKDGNVISRGRENDGGVSVYQGSSASSGPRSSRNGRGKAPPRGTCRERKPARKA